MKAMHGEPILLISANEEDCDSLLSSFESGRWAIRHCRSIGEARGCLLGSYPIVVCDQSLVDGDWKSVLSILRVAAAVPHLIVMSRLADEALWAEVLNCGGYDLLAKPLAKSEVLWVLQSASISLAQLQEPCSSRLDSQSEGSGVSSLRAPPKV